MSQEYTPTTWVDETTSTQGTLINAERMNNLEGAHHYADGFKEVDAVPTEDPGTDYNQVVYCTADSTLYRWDGTEWAADIDDNAVQLTGDQTVAGTKTFSDGIAVTGTLTASGTETHTGLVTIARDTEVLDFQHSTLEYDATPSANGYLLQYYRDKDGDEIGSYGIRKLTGGRTQWSTYIKDADGSTTLGIRKEAGETAGYAFCDTPSSDAPTAAITTIAYVSDTSGTYGNNLLHTNGAETKAGILTLSDGLVSADVTATTATLTSATVPTLTATTSSLGSASASALSVSGAATLASTLDVTGTTTLATASITALTATSATIPTLTTTTATIDGLTATSATLTSANIPSLTATAADLGTATATSLTVSGTLTASLTGNADTATYATSAGSATTATTATALGTATVGGATTPIYLDAGAPTACNEVMDLASAQTATGAKTFSGGIISTGATTLAATTATTLSLSSTLAVTGATTLTGSLTASSTAAFSGVATFTATPNITGTRPTLALTNTVSVWDTTPASNLYDIINFYDKDGTAEGGVALGHYTAGSKKTYIYTVGQDGTTANLELYALADGTAYATAPTPTSAVTATTAVATVGYVSASGSGRANNLIHDNGNESKVGTMTFKGVPGDIKIMSTSVDVTNPPSSETITGLVECVDANEVVVGQIVFVTATDGSAYINVTARNADGTYNAARLVTGSS